jgi:polar amino acid transport system substrate-binding protein
LTLNLMPRLAAVALCLLSALPLAQASDTLDRIAKTRTLVNVVDQSYPPFSFLNDKNQMDGFDIDVAKAVADKLGVKLRVETPSWEIVTAGRWRGRWDVCICSLTPDQKKGQVLDFVTPYYSSPAVLVTTAQNTALQTVKDMNGKRIGVEQGSSYERYLQKDLVIAAPGMSQSPPLGYPFASVRVAPYSSEDLAYQDLALGAGKRINAIVSNAITAKARIDKLPGKFRIVGEPLYAEPNWVAVDKGDADWQRKLVEVFAQLKQDGTLARLSLRWLGQDATR